MRDRPNTPDDLMPLDQALAVVFIHDQQGRPWVIGAEQVVLDRAKRTVRYYADWTLWSEASALPTAKSEG